MAPGDGKIPAMNSLKEIKKNLVDNSFAAPAVGIFFLTIWTIVVGGQTTSGDLEQMLEPVRQLLDGNLNYVFPEDTWITSMTGWLLPVTPLFAAARLFFEDIQAWILAGMIAVPLLASGTKLALNRFAGQMSEWSKWAVVCLVFVVPTTLACWMNFYHPQDIAAVGMVTLSVVLLSKNRFGWAAILLGVAVLTRQWTLFAVLLGAPIVANKTDNKTAVKFLTLTAVTTVVGLIPFLWNPGWFDAFSGSVTVGKSESLVGLLLQSTESSLFARGVRLVPLAAVGLLSLWMWRKKVDEWFWVFPAMAAAIGFRMFVESAPYLYYWGPFTIFAILSTFSLPIEKVSKAKFTLSFVLFSFLVWVVPTLIRDERYDANKQPVGEFFNDVLAGFHVFSSLLALFMIYLLVGKVNKQYVSPPHVDEEKKAAGQGSKQRIVFYAASIFLASLVVLGFTSTFYAQPQSIPLESEEVSRYLTYSDSVLVEGPQFSRVPQPGDVLPNVTGQNHLGETLQIGNDGQRKAFLFVSHWEKDSQNIFLSEVATFPSNFYTFFVGNDDKRGNWPTSLWIVSSGWSEKNVLDDKAGTLRNAFGGVSPATLLITDESNVVVASETVTSYEDIEKVFSTWNI